MSRVNPKPSASLHSKHPHCTDQLYMLGNGNNPKPTQLLALISGLKNSSEACTIEPWLWEQVEAGEADGRVFPRAVITTAIGANVVTSQAYHRILKWVDNHVPIDCKAGMLSGMLPLYYFLQR